MVMDMTMRCTAMPSIMKVGTVQVQLLGIWRSKGALAFLFLVGAYRVFGQSNRDAAGSAIAGAGDTNGDGYADVLIGAGVDTKWENAAQCISFTGITVVRSMQLDGANAEILGESYNSAAGVSVSSAGDVNLDGYDDILIGAPGYRSLRGRAYVIHGKAGGIVDMNLSDADVKITGEYKRHQVGSSVTRGDLNGDGYEELVIGAHNQGGEQAIFLGSAAGMMDMTYSDANAVLIGELHGKLDILAETSTV